MTTLAPSLTPTEQRLLVFFEAHRGRVMAAEFIYESVWRRFAAYGPWRQSLKVYISRLRRKAGVEILAERGYGYWMV